MSNSLFTALSGLQAFQNWIDVIGNNLANTNTAGFKTSRATFNSNFSQTLRAATPDSGTIGGTNPTQIGNGVSLGDIARNFNQGALTDTGRTFDLAMNGNGFFALSSGSQNFYTRVGTFGLDSVNNLVDLATGYKVLNPQGQALNLDVDSLYPPSGTANVEMVGNLPGTVSGPMAEVLTSATGFVHGQPAQLAATQTGPFTIPSGETWTMSVAVNGGAPQPVSIVGTGAPVTSADVAAAISSLTDVTATVNGAGLVEMVSNRTGETVNMKVNPGQSGKDLASMIGISTTLTTGSQAPLIPGVTTLNDLPGNVNGYQDGDRINITAVDTDGTPINASFEYGAAFDGTTVDDFVSFVDSLFTDAQVSLNATGQVVVEAQTSGEADLLLAFTDEVGQQGKMDWTTYAASETTEGTGPDTVIASTEVYDPAGGSHTLTMTFERQDDGTWNGIPSVDPAAGTVLSGPITGLQFDGDGAPIGLGAVSKTVSVQFNGQSGGQSIELDLGSDGEFSGLTQFGSEANVYVSEQDGFGSGELASLSVEVDGNINGFYTNGQFRSLGEVGVATFANEEGLRETGENLWGRTANSGSIVMGKAAIGKAGSMIGGALENSNVDTAEQFVYLIEAQRGFQASSRVISIQDEILSETVNLI
jgi:flagellar hook protein FlgE